MAVQRKAVLRFATQPYHHLEHGILTNIQYSTVSSIIPYIWTHLLAIACSSKLEFPSICVIWTSISISGFSHCLPIREQNSLYRMGRGESLSTGTPWVSGERSNRTNLSGPQADEPRVSGSSLRDWSEFFAVGGLWDTTTKKCQQLRKRDYSQS